MRMVFNLGSKKRTIKEIADAIYACLAASDKNYSKELHDQGELLLIDTSNRIARWNYKPFHFSHPYYSRGEYKVKIASMDSKFWYHFIQEINRLVRENLFRKLKAFGIPRIDNSFFKITKIWNISRKDKKYKGENIPAFYANMHIYATEDVFKTAYYYGVGSKNALGFGMIETADWSN